MLCFGKCLPGMLWHDSTTRSVLTTSSPVPVVYGTKNRKNKVKIGEKSWNIPRSSSPASSRKAGFLQECAPQCWWRPFGAQVKYRIQYVQFEEIIWVPGSRILTWRCRGVSTWTLEVYPLKISMQSQRKEKCRSPVTNSTPPNREAQVKLLGSFLLRKRFVGMTGVGGFFLRSAAVYKYLYTCGS